MEKKMMDMEIDRKQIERVENFKCYNTNEW